MSSWRAEQNLRGSPLSLSGEVSSRYLQVMKFDSNRGQVSSKNLRTAEARVATRLKQLRLEKGLTLAKLAAQAGFSSAFLSRVENHKISVPIASLEQLAGALEVSLSAFFEEESDRVPISLCRAGEGKKARLRGPRGFLYEIIVPHKKGKLMEPIIIEVDPTQSPPAKTHSGEEFNYVLEGECELTYGKQKIHLRSGDAVYYDAQVPHTSRALNGVPCRLLAAVASRDYLFHGDLSRLLNES